MLLPVATTTNIDFDAAWLEHKAYSDLMSKAKEARDWLAERKRQQASQEEGPDQDLVLLDLQQRDAEKIVARADLVNKVRMYLIQNQEATAGDVKSISAAADKRGSKRRRNGSTALVNGASSTSPSGIANSLAVAAANANGSSGIGSASDIAAALAAVTNNTPSLLSHRPSSSAEEDRAIRQKRSSRTLKMAVDEWYSYSMVDKDTYERRQVHVCGMCNFERTWLRELEELCTVQEFIFLLRKRIETLEDAKRLLSLGHHTRAEVNTIPITPLPSSSTNVTSRLTQKMREQKRKQKTSTSS